jgi:Ca2+-binding EF-hand superfamily protein
MLFLFSMEEEELSAEQKLKRSFHLYDRTESGKISKREMVEVMSYVLEYRKVIT